MVLDERRHTVCVDGQSINKLYDPGSYCTYIGRQAFWNFSTLLKKLADQPRPGIMCPNGVIEETAGQAILPLKFLGISKFLLIRFVPTFDCELLFGYDFAKLFDFDVRFKLRIWRLGNGIWQTYQRQMIGYGAIIPLKVSSNRVEASDVSLSNAAVQDCVDIKESNSSEDKYLEDFLKRKIPFMPAKLASTHMVEHHIDISGHPPFRQAYRHYSAKIESLRESAQKLEDEGIISPSKSKLYRPVVIVRKSDGNYRLCIDFRKLNEVAKKEAYPMRNISAISILD
ncbi:uncharacterized protein LOC117176622 [Belonocnema kinseyi]|uniref:uncharacterized protein LOC117176622 n=1 Tax=Belonocnema kinseyi TaxID=2817044 RepID=UPI00143DA755|nr:uncharacterized protein LOC117176622 [Belonocnema kinseyi]